MTRILWIVGLLVALVVFGGWTIAIVFEGIRHRHLNEKGFVMLFGDGYTAWITFCYLYQKVWEPRLERLAKRNDASLRPS